MKKNKYTYYLCYNEDKDCDITEQTEFTEDELQTLDFKFLSEVEYGEIISYSYSKSTSGIYKNKKLGDLIDDFIFDAYIDEEMENEEWYDDVDDRLQFLMEELTVFRYDPTMNIFKVIPPDKVMNTFEQKLNNVKTTKPKHDPKLTILPEYYHKFTKFLDLCFTDKSTGGILTVSTFDDDISWDVKKVDGEYFFGITEAHNELFKVNLADYFLKRSAGILRVITNQVVNNFPVKELYGFILLEDTQIINIDYLEVKDCHNSYKHGTVIPESNIVYCDLKGNKLCSED